MNFKRILTISVVCLCVCLMPRVSVVSADMSAATLAVVPDATELRDMAGAVVSFVEQVSQPRDAIAIMYSQSKRIKEWVSQGRIEKAAREVRLLRAQYEASCKKFAGNEEVMTVAAAILYSYRAVALGFLSEGDSEEAFSFMQEQIVLHKKNDALYEVYEFAPFIVEQLSRLVYRLVREEDDYVSALHVTLYSVSELCQYSRATKMVGVADRVLGSVTIVGTHFLREVTTYGTAGNDSFDHVTTLVKMLGYIEKTFRDEAPNVFQNRLSYVMNVYNRYFYLASRNSKGTPEDVHAGLVSLHSIMMSHDLGEIRTEEIKKAVSNYNFIAVDSIHDTAGDKGVDLLAMAEAIVGDKHSDQSVWEEIGYTISGYIQLSAVCMRAEPDDATALLERALQLYALYSHVDKVRIQSGAIVNLFSQIRGEYKRVERFEKEEALKAQCDEFYRTYIEGFEDELLQIRARVAREVAPANRAEYPLLSSA